MLRKSTVALAAIALTFTLITIGWSGPAKADREEARRSLAPVTYQGASPRIAGYVARANTLMAGCFRNGRVSSSQLTQHIAAADSLGRSVGPESDELTVIALSIERLWIARYACGQ